MPEDRRRRSKGQCQCAARCRGPVSGGAISWAAMKVAWAAARILCLDATTGHIACVSWSLRDEYDVGGHYNWALRHFVPDPEIMDHRPTPPTLKDVLVGERYMLQQFFASLELNLRLLDDDKAEMEWAAHKPVQLENGMWELQIPGMSGEYSRFVESKEAFMKKSLSKRTTIPSIQPT